MDSLTDKYIFLEHALLYNPPHYTLYGSRLYLFEQLHENMWEADHRPEYKEYDVGCNIVPS